MSGTKIALLVLFNHRYDKNIPILEDFYKNRFSNIFFIVPFYDGDKDNVIAVYDNSYYFSNYMAQAYQHLKKKGFTHFFFVADDMILNPAINENTLFDFLHISPEGSWIDSFHDCKTRPYHWRVPLFISAKQKGVEVKNMLPSVSEVRKIFDEHGISYFPSRWYAFKVFLKDLRPHRNAPRACLHALSYIFRFDLIELYKLKDYYPGIWGDADVLLISSNDMPKFAQYCGIFASLKVFVENAVPYSLLLASSKVQTMKDTGLRSIGQLYALGKEKENEFYQKYNYSLEKLMSDYPKDVVYIHPIKLSKWK